MIGKKSLKRRIHTCLSIEASTHHKDKGYPMLGLLLKNIKVTVFSLAYVTSGVEWSSYNLDHVRVGGCRRVVMD
jgi:hypothetical protein